METKKYLQNLGFVFTTLDGGAINANHIGLDISVTAKTLPTLRKLISVELQKLRN